ncbi:MAG: YitT family protein [Prevotella sp.]|jgi:yitT family protein|uniref:YitT family protein n=1 Tax=Alloprevotella sp. TaxID=1872471 RepID=UPI0015A9E103|nr:YitT family protein [Prevotella sp.]
MGKKIGISSVVQNVQDYLVITFGLVLYATGFTCFQLPYEITTGGLAGAGAVLFYATGFPVHYTFFIVNILLLCVAIKVLGWKFCVKTIYAVFMLTFLLALAKTIMMEVAANAPDGTYVISPQGLPQLVGNNGMFMSCVIGASIEGVGIGLVFLSNGSTGGTDIIAAIINKYRDVTLGQMMMLCDVIIITSSLLLPTGSVERLLYGYCTLIITNLLLDYVVDRGRQSVQFFIFSLKYDEIAGAINKLHRGVTVLNGQGWYTKHERKVLVVLAKKRESTTIFRIIQNIDPGAFVSQSKVIGVFGYGFDKIKVKAKSDKKNLPVGVIAENPDDASGKGSEEKK